jgi:UDP-galactopyranose mutase
MRHVHTLIIGGGPSGLSLAYGLQGNTLIVEKESSVGGLCRSIKHGSGVFDIGGHSFHTPYPEVYALVESLLGDDLFLQPRDARVFTHGILIPYPFQKYYDRIPDSDVVRACEEGLRNASGNAAVAENFEEYIIRKFGQGIADHFMLPYNRKLWARDIKQISCEWTSERVAAPKGEHETFDNTGGQRKPLQANTKVGYPRQGGYEEIYKSFVSHIPGIELNSPIIHIDPQKRTATTAQGQGYRWERLVSTIPLPVITQIVEGTPEAIRAMARQLSFMSLRVELFLTGRPLDTSIQRIYVADPDIPPHKIALNHNSSDYLRAQPQHGIMAEVSHSSQKPLKGDETAPKTIDFLCQCGVLETPDDIVWQGHVDVKYAYPVYTHDRLALVFGIKEWLAQHAIYTLGRFGDWEYINSDKCVMKGLAFARELREKYATRELKEE